MRKKLVVLLLFLGIVACIFIVVRDVMNTRQELKIKEVKKKENNLHEKPLKIAIIDNGANLEDVNYNKKINVITYNVLDDSQNVSSSSNRGTLLFSALYNNVFSMNKKNDVMIIKAFENSRNIDNNNIVKGLKYACDNGASIINMSYLLDDDESLDQQVKACQSKGVDIVTLVTKGKDSQYPAQYDGVISVSNNKQITSDIVLDKTKQVSCLKDRCVFNQSVVLAPIYVVGYLVDYVDRTKELKKVNLKPVYINAPN